MNILFLTQIVPYPPDAGPKVKTWHVLRYLAERGHRVILASFVRSEEQKHLEELKDICSDIYAVPMRRSRIADAGYWLRSNFTGRPFLIERDDIKKMRDLVDNLIGKENIDVIHADQLGMAQFALPYTDKSSPGKTKPISVFDAHNAVWTIVERMQENVPGFLRPIAAMEAKRIKHYEAMIVDRFTHTLAVTKQDQAALLEAVGETFGEQTSQAAAKRITVVPIAVDTEQLTPVERAPESMNILTLGTLHYPPNADGIRWFAKEVFPIIHQQIPRATLTIVGKNPPIDFVEMASQEPNSYRVTGYVEDLTPYMESAALLVVPVRAGGGMRVRILEAFARAMPVVTTTIGLEGIDAIPGEDVLVADSSLAFAEAVNDLLMDKSSQEKLAQNGRRLAETRYDWKIVLDQMNRIYDSANVEELVVRHAR